MKNERNDETSANDTRGRLTVFDCINVVLVLVVIISRFEFQTFEPGVSFVYLLFVRTAGGRSPLPPPLATAYSGE